MNRIITLSAVFIISIFAFAVSLSADDITLTTLAPAGVGGWKAANNDVNNICNSNTGNVGIGNVDPVKKLDITGGLRLRQNVGDGGAGDNAAASLIEFTDRHLAWGYGLAWNAYFDGSWKYRNTDFAAMVGLGDGTNQGDLVFATFPSGSAGAEISLTNYERMRITNTGNVGIGTINPQAKLEISTSSEHLLLDRESTETTGGKIVFLELRQLDPLNAIPEVYPSIRFHHNTKFWHRIEGRTDGIHFKTGDLLSDSYIKILAGDGIFSGNVGIGTASPSAQLDIFDSTLSAGTPFLRIGDDTFFTDVDAANVLGIYGNQNNDRATIRLGSSGADISGLNGNIGIGITDPGTYKLNINGTGYLNSAAWVYGSDMRLKENIVSITSGLNIIEKLNPVKFDYIKGEKKQTGFIAQEVEKVLPDIVVRQKDGMFGLKTESIIPYLVKSIQEQQKEIDSLKKRIETLEKK